MEKCLTNMTDFIDPTSVYIEEVAIAVNHIGLRS